MMGLLALMSSMLISLNVQRASLNAKVQVIDNEMETMAGGVALEVLDYIGTKDFDSATADGKEVNSPNELTPQPFSTGQPFASADDVDDFHGMQTHTVAEFGFEFNVDAVVQYVNEDDPEQTSGSQTYAKRVTVTVSSEHLRSPVQISHVYSYP